MQDFYEDELKLFSNLVDIHVYFTVELYIEVKSWMPIDGVRLEAKESFVENIILDDFEATEYLDIGTKTVVGSDEESMLRLYPQFEKPWNTFKHNLLGRR